MKIFEELKSKIAEDAASFIVILGAGASIPAGLPSWVQLKDRLYNILSDVYEDPDDLKDAQAYIDSAPNLWKSFSRLRSKLGAARYEREITNALDCSGLDIPDLYKQIWQLNVSGIINFNLDKFALDAYSEIKHRTVDFATGIEPHKYKNYSVSSEKFVFHPHGIISDVSSWVFRDSEYHNCYSNSDFKNIITTLLNSKNLLILGFNATEWNFQQLLFDCGITGRINGFHNYYFCPNASPDIQRELGDLGISVISYTPSSTKHEELNGLLDEIINYHSVDTLLPSIYTGRLYTEEDIPVGNACYELSISELRDVLNGVVSSIIPPTTTPTKDQIDNLEKFYNTHIIQLHRAWLVDPRSDDTAYIYGYKVTRFIGNGAFGSVYEAENDHGQRFALKVLLPDVKDKISYLSCFRRGIRSMRILTDKGINGMVKIHDSYEIPACIVMDLVDGVTLREAIQQRFLTRLEIKLCILEDVARIIYSAHQLEERILHRDIKPENVMLENGFSAQDFKDPSDIPKVKVLDFDLSWHRGATEMTVMFGAISQGFMAPEQSDTTVDRSLSRNAAVDVYSIGMLTYYVLTGNNPRPNEAQFATFPEDVKTGLQRAYPYNWKCLPIYLLDLILKATAVDPYQRISLDAFIQSLSIARNMFINQQIPNTHPLVLAEIKERLGECTNIRSFDFGRKFILEYSAISKRVVLLTSSDRSKIILTVEIERFATNSDRRDGLYKYLKQIVEKAASNADKTLFFAVATESSETNAVVRMSAQLPDIITLDYIKRISDNILLVRQKFDT